MDPFHSNATVNGDWAGREKLGNDMVLGNDILNQCGKCHTA